MGVRDKVKEFLDKNLKPNIKVTSNGDTAGLFTTLTGMSQSSLQTAWKSEDKAKKERRDQGLSTAGLPTTTSCNSFVCIVGNQFNAPLPLGQFDIEKKLKRAGMGDAWIPAKSGKKPGYGDPFKATKTHMGVSLDFSGEMWNTAEGGQGGPGQDYTQGFDVVMRKQQPWNPSYLEGWVDIEILMQIAQKVPHWMVGWWKFEIGAAKDKEFVYLPERGAATSLPTAPANLKLPAAAGAGKSGKMVYDGETNVLTINWSETITDALKHLQALGIILGERGGLEVQGFKLK